MAATVLKSGLSRKSSGDLSHDGEGVVPPTEQIRHQNRGYANSRSKANEPCPPKPNGANPRPWNIVKCG